MKIEVVRQACCSQDDQNGSLSRGFSIDDRMTVQDLARTIGEAKFLQFTGTHSVIYICSEGDPLFSIPALNLEGGSVEYFVDKYEFILNHIKTEKIDCLWPEELKGNKLGQARLK